MIGYLDFLGTAWSTAPKLVWAVILQGTNATQCLSKWSTKTGFLYWKDRCRFSDWFEAHYLASEWGTWNLDYKCQHSPAHSILKVYANSKSFHPLASYKHEGFNCSPTYPDLRWSDRAHRRMHYKKVWMRTMGWLLWRPSLRSKFSNNDWLNSARLTFLRDASVWKHIE